MKFTITKSLHIKVFVIALAIAYVLYDQINATLMDYQVDIFNITDSIVLYWVALLAIVLVMSFIHEIFHAMAYMVFGGKVQIGFKGIYAYTKEISGLSIKGIQMIIILLTPVIIMSTPLLFSSHWLFRFVFIFNLVGSLGDIFMTLFILKNKGFRKKVTDLDDGFILE